MISIDIEYNEQGQLAKITLGGHAGYAPHGQDIVCAAVSAIIQTAALGLEAIAQSYPDHAQLRVRHGGAIQEAGEPDTTGTTNGGV